VSERLAVVICGCFVHYPRNLESWPVFSVGDLFIIPGVLKVGSCYLWVICPLSEEFRKLTSVSVGEVFIIPGVWKVGCCYLWAICPLSQEFGNLASVFCGRFVCYPRSFKSWLLLSVGDLFIIPGVWQVDQCYLWAICSLSQQSGKLTGVICGPFVHYPSSLASWPVLSVGHLFIIPAVWQVDQCYQLAIL